MLQKSLYLLAKEHGAQWVLLISLRALTRYYRGIGFERVPSENAVFDVPGLKAEPYWAMRAHVGTWEQTLKRVHPVAAQDVFETRHPDVLGPDEPR